MNSAHEGAFACPRVEMHLYNTLLPVEPNKHAEPGTKKRPQPMATVFSLSERRRLTRGGR